MNTSCQSYSAPITGSEIDGHELIHAIAAPPASSDMPVPAMNPKLSTAMARGSCRGGKRSAIIEKVAGPLHDSPAPTPMRATNSCQKFCARPHSVVAILQAVIPQVKMTRRLRTSTMRAIGKPRITYMHTNAKPMIRLIRKSLRCRSRLMGCTRSPTIPRSRKLTISASANIPTAYHACLGLGQGRSLAAGCPGAAEVRSFTAHLGSHCCLMPGASFLRARRPSSMAMRWGSGAASGNAARIPSNSSRNSSLNSACGKM